MFGANTEGHGWQSVPGGGRGGVVVVVVDVQACIMTVGMRVPYMSLWESHLTEVHCERAK